VAEPVAVPVAEPVAVPVAGSSLGGAAVAIRPAPPVEERTPGSPFILPVNPLAQLSEESLFGFVECSLYEETDSFSFEELLARPPSADEDEALVPDFRLLRPYPHPPNTPPRPPVMPGSYQPPVEVAPLAALAIAPPSPPRLPRSFEPPRPRRRWPILLAAVAVAAAAVSAAILLAADRGAVASAPSPQTAAAATTPRTTAASKAAEIRTAAPEAALAPPKPAEPGPAQPGSPHPVARAPALATAARPADARPADRPADARPADALADARPADAQPADALADARPAEARPAEARPADARPAEARPAALPDDAPTTGDCRVNLASYPDGATVLLAGRVAGITPVTLALPCRRTMITLKRPRYALLDKAIVPTAGAPLDLRLALHRPEHTVRIVSTPGAATVSIDGRDLGITPVTATVLGFTTVDIELRKPGFRKQRTRVYMRAPGQVVALRLAK